MIYPASFCTNPVNKEKVVDLPAPLSPSRQNS